MSDTDEFDKEAERERLREKYEADQAEREATQRMSDLLLQGATMTNRHCEECGDPLFRYDGEVFCPSCGAGTDAAGASGEAEAGGSPAAGEDGGAAGAATGVETPAGGEGTAAAEETGTGTAAPPRDDARAVDTPRATHPGAGPGRSLGTGGTPTAGGDGTPPTAVSEGASSGAPEPAATEPASGADDPRTRLAATAALMARRADAATDPRQAREWLAAAREAAEALAALDGHDQ